MNVFNPTSVPNVTRLVRRTRRQEALRPHNLNRNRLTRTLARTPSRRRQSYANFKSAGISRHNLTSFSPVPHNRRRNATSIRLGNIRNLKRKDVHALLIYWLSVSRQGKGPIGF